MLSVSISAHRLNATVAAALVACCSVSTQAQTAAVQPNLPDVIVSASRQPQSLQTAPIGATILSAEDIERSGAADANEAIRKLTGISAKTDLTGGRDYTLDLRGYGETANQNVVVLVDGIRISENEQTTARLTAIPLAQIERIEIIRGGASVMWGEGASAGVINVILKHDPNAVSSGRLSAAVESFNGQDLRGSGVLNLGTVVLDGAVRRVRSDGYRDNSAYQQDSGSAGIQWADKGWRIKARVQQENTDAGLPGPLNFAQYAANPRQTINPFDFTDADETRYTTNVEYRLGPWVAQLDVGVKDRKTRSSSYGSYSETDSHNTQWSPRLAYSGQLGAIGNTSVVGADVQHWTYERTSSVTEPGRQSNQAVFGHTEFVLPSQTRVALGARSERIRKEDNYPGTLVPYFTSPATYDRKDHVNASELALSQTLLTGLDLYGRLASSYRLPNIDDNRLTPLQQALVPQENRDREVGLKWAQGRNSATARVFRQTTRNEIALDPIIFANVNLDPTQREGYELEGRWSPLSWWDFSANWQHIDATFRSRPKAGQKQALVAPDTAALRTTVRFNQEHQIDAGIQYLSSMPFSDYSGNICSRRIPTSTLLDARYAWSHQAWQVAVSGTNLTDHKGYNYAYDCTAGALYPEPGRALKLTIARSF